MGSVIVTKPDYFYLFLFDVTNAQAVQKLKMQTWIFTSELETVQVASSSPGNVWYISHVHRAYDYSGPFGVPLVHMAWYKNWV